MAKKEQRNLFSKLTKLFRSGPVVKRKIRALDTSSVKPDTSKSSGTLLFQKSLSPTYATITSNAYNLSERLMRYQDFCFGGDVIVYTLDGAMTFKELVQRYPNGERFFVYSYDYELKQPVIGTAFCPRLAREGKKSSLLRVKFDDGGYVDVTPDHKMVLRDGSTREAKDLKVNDSLMPLSMNDVTNARYSFERGEVTFSSVIDACSAFNGDISSIMSRLYVNHIHVEQMLRDNGFNDLSDVMSRLNEAHRLATHLSIERETRRPTLLEIQYFASVCQSVDEAAARLRCSRHAVNTCLSLAGHKDWDQYRSNFYHLDIGQIYVTGNRSVTGIEILDDDFTYTVTVEKHHNLAVGIANNYVFATQSEMEYCLDSTTCIPTVDGMVELGELARRCDADPDYQFIVYSYDHEKQEIVPAFGKQARQTRVDHAWKVTFDSGKTITGSGNHRLMMRDGTYREIRDLQPGDSMMPFYRKDFYADGVKGTPGYSWIYNMNKWVAEHRLIAEWVEGRQLTDDEVVHHVNFVKSDNRPENLRVMTRSAHSSYHAGINNDHKWDASNSDWIEKFKRNHAVWMRDNAPTGRKDVTFGRILEVSECLGFDLAKVSKALDVDKNVIYSRLADNGFSTYESFTTAYKFGNAAIDGKRSLCVSDLDLETVIATMEQHDSKQQLCIKLGCTVNVLNKFLDRKVGSSWSDLRKQKGWSDEGHRGGRPRGMNGNALTFQQVCDAYVSGMSLPMLAEKLSVNKNTIVSRIAQHGFKKYSEFQSNYENHKVVSVEYVGVIPLFDFTVDGYKNFATDSVISHNTPEIAGALDIYADETVAQDDMGKVLHVYSENEKIKETLEELFYDTLNVEFNARSWVRNLCKYGDAFLYIDVDPKYGVVNAFPIPVNEIEREENFDREDPFAVRFRWVTMGNRTLENWEIAHFRLLGNDMFIPYGSSIIEPARRIWRQLILIEDAMLVYRVCRAPERRVFYIDVANVPAENVPMYVEEQKKNLRSSQVIDGSTGRVDLRYNPMPVHKDTPVPLLDGRTLTIEQLAAEHKTGADLWVYSVQDGTQRIVPGKVAWCGKNYTADKIVKVTLDDGTYVKTAPEHPFIMRDGTTKRADELMTGDSLMPLYTKLSSKQLGFDIEGYQTVYDPHSESYKFVHRIVANDVLAEQRESTRAMTDWSVNNNLTVHHIDINRFNNDPSNLRWMGNVDHIKWHASVGRENLIKWNKSEKKKQLVSRLNKERNSVAAMSGYNGSALHASHNEARRQAQFASWNENKQERSQAMRWVVPDEFFVIGKEKLLNDPTLNSDRFHSAMMADSRVIELLKSSQTSKRDVSKFSYGTWIQQLRANGCNGFDEFKRSTLGSAYKRRKNHSVINVEIVDECVDVYCMTIVGANGENDRHNFAVLGTSDQRSDKMSATSGIYSLSGIFVKNSVEEDYFLPVRGAESGTKIDTLKGGENTAAVEDVAYIQKKLFAALKIPRAYLGYDDALSSKATLAQEDIRFSRTINVIQKTLIAELNKIAIIHLYAHGFDGEDLQNFTLRLSNPSSIAQQQKLELWRAKFEIGGSMPEGMGSATMVQRDIWGLTPERIMQLRRERMEEQLFNAQIEAAVTNLGSGGAGGDDLMGDLGGGGGGGAPPKPPAGGAEKPPAGEKKTPPPETAGEIPDEDEEPELELLTSADDAQDGEERSLKRQGSAAPLKAVDRIKHYQYNRSRIDHGSAGRTHMPDFAKMTGNDNDAMKDPTDSGWMKSLVSDPFSESVRTRTVPTKSMLSMLVRMKGVVRQVSDDSLLTEGIEVIDDLAADGVDAGIDVSDDD